MRPFGLTIKPEPTPEIARGVLLWPSCEFGMACLKNAKRGSSPSIASEPGPEAGAEAEAAAAPACALFCALFCTTARMFTTAGP
jgi:hypothetical protein